jgi:hypothetical protein
MAQEMEAQEIVELLGMLPHPEGGYYKVCHACSILFPLSRNRDSFICSHRRQGWLHTSWLWS